jgi:tetratricopeptide (TPR) repeat protein
MNESPGYRANLQRGQLLRMSGRYREACQFFGEAIQADPQQAQPYLELALARSDMPGGKDASLQAIDRAIALEPVSSRFLGWKAVLLSQFNLNGEAVQVARSALELDPCNSNALLAQAHVSTNLDQWQRVEELTRRVLELDAHNVNALNLLAQSLRFQDRLDESNQVIEALFAFMPNDAAGHANAGYAALKVGDHRRANRHFLEALRSNPGSDHARRGLVQSLRTRIWIYRVNVRLIELCHSSQKRTPAARLTLVFVTLFSCGLFFVLLILYLPISLSLQPLSNFFLLLEPTGRRALTKTERTWGLCTGLLTIALVAFLAVGHLSIFALLLGCHLGLFALGVYLPQWADLRRARREKHRLERVNVASARPLAQAR